MDGSGSISGYEGAWEVEGNVIDSLVNSMGGLFVAFKLIAATLPLLTPYILKQRLLQPFAVTVHNR